MRKYTVFFIVLMSLTCSVLWAQPIYKHMGDTVVLELPLFRGAVQWQKSMDNSSWTAITGATQASYLFPVLENGWYRAQIKEDSCSPILSSPIQIILAGIKDVEGNYYDTITVGKQVWLKQAIRSTKYADGTSITTGLYAFDNLESNVSDFGRLYTWNVAMKNSTIEGAQGVCPTGFHIPRKIEWEQLINLYGGKLIAGLHLKSTDSLLWKTPNLANNSSGFSLLPSGDYDTQLDKFYYKRYFSNVWSSTTSSNMSTHAYKLFVENKSTFAYVSDTLAIKHMAYAVRCVKDCDVMQQAQAGVNQLELMDTNVVLTGNIPSKTKGKWVIAQGSGGVIINDTLYNSIFKGIKGQSYALVWTLTNPPCFEQSTDTVIISFSPYPVQYRLDKGETPLSIYKSGISLDSIYGKTFQGGLICHLNTSTGKGLIAAPTDQGTLIEWGCYSTIFVNALSAGIGEGKINTDSIVAKCSTVGIAAQLCDELIIGNYSDWYLPTKYELNEMYQNLFLKNVGGFIEAAYWSSTEIDASNAYNVHFNTGSITAVGKFNQIRVRAIRAF